MAAMGFSKITQTCMNDSKQQFGSLFGVVKLYDMKLKKVILHYADLFNSNSGNSSTTA